MRKDALIRALSENLHLDRSQVERFLGEWILTKEALDTEERVLWKSKQKTRMLRRPFLDFPHRTGEHLCFSKGYANRSLGYVFREMTFGALPETWYTPELETALRRALREIDHRWEHHVHEALEVKGLPGLCGVKTFRRADGTCVEIPAEVGEIDLIHVCQSENVLYVGEVKRIRQQFHPRDQADDKSKFITRNDAYVPKFLKKIRWVAANWKVVCEHLASTKKMSTVPTAPPRIQHAMITDFESVAQAFVTETLITSLRRLISEHDKTGAWPFYESSQGDLCPRATP
jgi:hypothetical protein